MPTTSTSPDRMTVDIPRAARLLGISRKAAYAAAVPGGDLPTVPLGNRKVVAKGWLCQQLHLTLEQLEDALAALDADHDEPANDPDAVELAPHQQLVPGTVCFCPGDVQQLRAPQDGTRFCTTCGGEA